MTLNAPRAALAIASAALTLTAAAPAAQAAPPTVVGVCNQASAHFVDGNLLSFDAPSGSPAERYTVDITTLPGKGKGLANAAAHSKSLTVCGIPGQDPVIVDPGTGDISDGGVWAT